MRIGYDDDGGVEINDGHDECAKDDEEQQQQPARCVVKEKAGNTADGASE